MNRPLSRNKPRSCALRELSRRAKRAFATLLRPKRQTFPTSGLPQPPGRFISVILPCWLSYTRQLS